MSKINAQTLRSAISTVLESSEKRNCKFTESVDLQITLKKYNLLKDKRFHGTVRLKHVARPQLKVCIFGDQAHCDEAQANNIPCLSTEELKLLKKDRKLVKKLEKKYDAFLASFSIIKMVPRLLGPRIGRCKKFPQVVTHDVSLVSRVTDLRSSIKFKLKKELCLAACIGHVKMTEEELYSNITLAINFLVSLLKKKWQNIRTLHIKSTMTPSQRIY